MGEQSLTSSDTHFAWSQFLSDGSIFLSHFMKKWTRKELIYAEENLPTKEATPRTCTWFPKTHVDFWRAQGFEAPPPARAPQPGYQSQQSRQTQQLLRTACQSWQDGGIV